QGASSEQRAPSAADGAIGPGAFVCVESGGTWWPASVVGPAGDGWLVQYDGWPESTREQVAAARVRRAPDRADVAPGDRVLVAQRIGHLAASVVALGTDGRVRVRYDGAPGDAEEDVLPARIKR